MCENLAPAHPIGMPRPIRIYYPGFISLVGMIALLWAYYNDSYYYMHRHQPRAIWMFLPRDDDKSNETVTSFSKYNVLEGLKNKRITRVQLDEYHDGGTKPAKVDFIRREIKRMTFTHDSSAVLKVVFCITSKYGDMMGVMRFLAFYGVKRYALIDDALYIFGNWPPEPLPEWTDL